MDAPLSQYAAKAICPELRAISCHPAAGPKSCRSRIVTDSLNNLPAFRSEPVQASPAYAEGGLGFSFASINFTKEKSSGIFS